MVEVVKAGEIITVGINIKEPAFILLNASGAQGFAG